VRLTKEQEKEATQQLLAALEQDPKGLTTAQLSDACKLRESQVVRRLLRAAGAQEEKRLVGGIRYLLIWKSPAPTDAAK